MRILLVEDDQLLGDGIATGLKENNYTVDWLQDGLSAVKATKHEHFDIIVLDLGLPKKSGIEVLKHLRQNKINTPVIILTAKDTIEDRVAGLDAGADDYLTKPFELQELCARLRACQRRVNSSINSEIMIGNVKLDTASHKMYINEINMPLSRREFSLMHKLLENPGKVVSRDILSQSIYGWGDDVDSNAIEVHIHNLRKKIGNSIMLRTIRGVGYIIEESE
ncbi:MAG: response regulator transcription factor [Legionellales bacterium]|jgi:two-component system, OmpR family, response regulator QseB|nr:response regulator transcription factor [Legionellales bacterium]